MDVAGGWLGTDVGGADSALIRSLIANKWLEPPATGYPWRSFSRVA